MSDSWIDALELPFRGVREARSRLEDLERRRARLQQLGREMVAEFRERFPNAPAYPAHYSDRTLTAYRWRRAGHNAVSVDITSDTGRAMLDRIPVEARRTWLAFERRRVHLNLALSVNDYERMRLRDLLARVERVRDAERAV